MVTDIKDFKSKKQASKKIDKSIIIISILMLAIIPNVMHRKNVASFSPIVAGHPYATGTHLDVFNYYKSVLVNVGALLMLGLYSYKVLVLGQEIKKHILNIVIPVLVVVILVSGILSDYPSIAFFGNHDRFEGSIAWFSYLIIFFVLFNTNIESKYYKFYYIAFVPFIVLNSIFSISYLYGNNLLEQEWLNSLLGGNLNGFLITTLYHANFGSGMSAVVFGITFMYLLLEKDLKVKAGLLFLSVLCFAMLLAMASSGGFVTFLIVLPFILVVGCRINGIKQTALWSALTFGLNFVVYTVFSKVNEKVYNESFAIVEKVNSISSAIIPVCLVIFGLIVLVSKFVNRKKVFDVILGVSAVSILIGFFVISSQVENNFDKIKENPIYQKVNEISTDRINIWLKTINLMDGDILVGNGLDTLPFKMASEDPDKGVSTYGEFIDKPHNWYLTIAYGAGLIGLFGVLFVIGFVFRSLFFNLDDKKDNLYVYVFGIGVFAYAVQALSNDSFSGTSIIFWIVSAFVCSVFRKEKSL